MLKKYVPYLVLLLAAIALYFVKTHQRGANSSENIDITTNAVTSDEGFSRHPANIIYTKHARCRMECRHISEEEVKEIIATGKVKEDKIERGREGKTYPLDGRTKNDKLVRVVVAPKNDDLVIVTVIDLDTDWPCGDCK